MPPPLTKIPHMPVLCLKIEFGGLIILGFIKIELNSYKFGNVFGFIIFFWRPSTGERVRPAGV